MEAEAPDHVMKLPEVEGPEKWVGRILLWTKSWSSQDFSCFAVMNGWKHRRRPRLPRLLPTQPDRIGVPLHLKRGDFTVYRSFRGDAKFTDASLGGNRFWAGDGGIPAWEVQFPDTPTSGYEVLGIDSALYAQTDYDLDTLQADVNTIAQSSLVRLVATAAFDPGGWSMGAEQAVPWQGVALIPRQGLVWTAADLTWRSRPLWTAFVRQNGYCSNGIWNLCPDGFCPQFEQNTCRPVECESRPPWFKCLAR